MRRSEVVRWKIATGWRIEAIPGVNLSFIAWDDEFFSFVLLFMFFFEWLEIYYRSKLVQR